VTLRHRSRASGFPARLRHAREAAEFTQTEVAEQTGYEGKQAISHLELGKRSADTRLVARLAQVLHVSPCALAFGFDVPGGSPDDYGPRFKKARERAGLTTRRFAQQLGYAGNSAVIELEMERRALDLHLCEVAARFLGVSPCWLAFGVEG